MMKSLIVAGLLTAGIAGAETLSIDFQSPQIYSYSADWTNPVVNGYSFTGDYYSSNTSSDYYVIGLVDEATNTVVDSIDFLFYTEGTNGTAGEEYLNVRVFANVNQSLSGASGEFLEPRDGFTTPITDLPAGLTFTATDIAPVDTTPEPAALIMMGLGLLGIGVVRRRR